jgi:hypothetical protein
MNLTLKLAMFSCAVTAASGATGCKLSECNEPTADGGMVKKENCLQVEPMVEYRDMRHRVGSQPWTSGRPISITNKNGDVKVAVGGEGDERVAFDGIAFTRETNNDEGGQKAKDKLTNMADPAFASGDYATLVAPGGGYDGYELTVWVPKDFNAALTVVTENGTTTLYGSEGAISTTVTSHAIVATDLRRAINLHANVGKIDFRGALSGAGNVVQADLGDITGTLGAASNVGITAKATETVTFPAAWNQVVNPDHMAGSATLGDGTGMLSVTADHGKIDFFAQ